MLTLISSFYNEELLLPYWLPHHRPMFDRIILVDYDSTDQSREVIDQFPGVEVRISRNRAFAADKVDAEAMEIERELEGWKVVLNTTEFLLGDVREIVARRVKGFKPCNVTLVDRQEDYGRTLDSRPLLQQRQHGIILGCEIRSRLIHPYPDGAYDIGRHAVNREWEYEPSLYSVHAMFSPWPQSIARKLQIQHRIPPNDLRKGWGWQHRTSADQLQGQWRRMTEKIVHLPSANEVYARALSDLSIKCPDVRGRVV